MKKEKNKYIILIILATVILILIVILFLMFLINNSKGIYGTWHSQKMVLIEDEKNTIEKEWLDFSINIQKNNKIKLCYKDNEKKKCGTTSYIYNNNILSINENDWFLKGKYFVSFKRNSLSLKYVYSDGQKDILYFKR